MAKDIESEMNEVFRYFKTESGEVICADIRVVPLKELLAEQLEQTQILRSALLEIISVFKEYVTAKGDKITFSEFGGIKLLTGEKHD